ncbi:MAG: helicase C-terminal domain-containing protein [Nitrospira sp.]|nr:helicase C-terminal domain-containing protein [Nitrospira sp.]
MSDTLNDCFNILKQNFPCYEARPQQLEMAEDVFTCLRDKENMLIEAGTGVGKSFAYLIPAILSGEKTVVSTASIALQDQLVSKDLVTLKNILPDEFSFGILKGKNNYLCLKRDREFVQTGELYDKFRDWASKTITGDKDELQFVPDFWFKVGGDSDDCSGKECPFYNDCFYYRHYRHLHNVDILITNHYLLMYDMLSEFNVLPFHNQLIIDEAHQIENVISNVFGTALSRSRILWLFYRLRGFKITVDHLFEPMDLFFKRRDKNGNADPSSQAVYPIPDDLIASLKEFSTLLSLNKIISRLKDCKDAPVEDEERDRAETTINYVKSLSRDIEDFIDQDDKDKVYYLGWNRDYLELKSNIVDSGTPFAGLVTCYNSIIMTSATLTAGGDFDYLKKRLGITEFREKIIGSPFDYKSQAMFYIDRTLPPPDKGNSEKFKQESLKTIEGLVNASKGRALVLFTSYSHLNFAAKNIKTDYPFKAQGDMPPSRLIKWFKDTPNSVLLATATFWQGIDIKGEKLSLVVIVKMPFGSPGDPVYDERCRRLKDKWFMELALPSAILMLRQGIGRLIRGADDRGVVAILDSRLVTGSYRKTIINSLPDMGIVYTIDEVEKFFE